MKFFRFCRRKSCDKDADPVHPEMQENMETVVQPYDGKRSASSTGIIDSEDTQIAAKIARFDLDVSTSNAWNLPISMVEYLNKYMHVHIPDKDIKEKILKENPVPANVKEPQVLDNYIKELLTKNKRTLTSTHEKSLKAVQEKVLYILGPLSRLWMMMEIEKLSSSGCGDEKVQEMTAISSLFEQTMLLIGQAFHSVTYYRRQNILCTLIDNPSKVKEILRDPDMALDNISNTCLFGDKFEEKLLKDSTAKQKSKLIFSGLQRKSANNSSGTSYNNQPFLGSPPPRFSASDGRGHFLRAASHTSKKNYSCVRKSSKKAGFEACGSSSTKSFSSRAEVMPTSSRQISTFSGKLTSDPQILELVEGYQIPFSSEPKQTKLPNSVHLTKKEESLIDLEIQAMLRTGAIRMVDKSQNQFLSPIFLVEKKDSGYRPVINLKKLNQNIPYIHFKMEGLSLLKELLQKGDFLCKLDLKDAYFSVALHKISRKYLRFPWQGKLYEFLCLCFSWDLLREFSQN